MLQCSLCSEQRLCWDCLGFSMLYAGLSVTPQKRWARKEIFSTLWGKDLNQECTKHGEQAAIWLFFCTCERLLHCIAWPRIISLKGTNVNIRWISFPLRVIRSLPLKRMLGPLWGANLQHHLLGDQLVISKMLYTPLKLCHNDASSIFQVYKGKYTGGRGVRCASICVMWYDHILRESHHIQHAETVFFFLNTC